MSEERKNKRPAVFMRYTRSGRGAVVNLPKHYIYFDWGDLNQFIEGNKDFIKGTVYRKKQGGKENGRE